MIQPKPPFFVFDIGGTRSRFSISLDGVNLGQTVFYMTPQDFSAGIAMIKTAVNSLAANVYLTACSGGIAGAFDKTRSTLVGAPNLQGWIGKPIRQEIQQILQAPVYLENDTAMVGLGEAAVGAGVSYSIVAYMTFSTGVNGVRVVERKIDVNARGFEIGHQIIDQGMELESFVGGAFVSKKFGIDPSQINDTGVWESLTKYIAYGVTNTILYWSPDIVVLGGSMMNKISVEAVKLNVKKILTIYSDLPDIVSASLHDTGGLFGSLHYLSTV